MKNTVVTDMKKLRKVSKPINNINKANKIAENLIRVTKGLGGRAVGLSAIQIGVNRRVCVLKVGQNSWRTFINPEVIKVSDKQSGMKESCFSIPMTMQSPFFITRPKDIKVRYLDEEGNQQVEKFKGLYSRALQHEVDHMNGILIIDKHLKGKGGI